MALAIEGVAASHMNPKKDRVNWCQCSFEWNLVGGDSASVHTRARQCAEAVLATRMACSNEHSFHYAGDKGYAGPVILQCSMCCQAQTM